MSKKLLLPLTGNPDILVDDNGFLHRKLKNGIVRPIAPRGGTGFVGSQIAYYSPYVPKRVTVQELKDRYDAAISGITV